MNEVVPDWMHHEDITRAVPNLSTNAEHPASTMEYQLWEQLREVKEENLALRADMAKLEAENAELREKCMTRFARIKNAANADDMAQMLHRVYMTGACDYVNSDHGFENLDTVEDMSYWLQEIGTI